MPQPQYFQGLWHSFFFSTVKDGILTTLNIFVNVSVKALKAGLLKPLKPESDREFDSCIIKKLLTGRIKPVFFCQVFCFII